MDKKLYRFIGFEDFVNLMINKKDRFAHPTSWDDKYEGFLFSHMEDEADVRNIVKIMYDILCVGNYDAIIKNYYNLWSGKWFTYGQCWSSHKETDAMWRCYSYGNKAVRLRTTESKLLKHVKTEFPAEEKYDVCLQKVKYDLKKNNTLEQQIVQMKVSKNPLEAYYHKRNVFSHESEYRLLVRNNQYYWFDSSSYKRAKFQIDEEIVGKNEEEIIDMLVDEIIKYRYQWNEKIDCRDMKIIDATNVSEFIDGVMIHPSAPDWYVSIIKDICSLTKIKFDGKSQIYTQY